MLWMGGDAGMVRIQGNGESDQQGSETSSLEACGSSYRHHTALQMKEDWVGWRGGQLAARL